MLERVSEDIKTAMKARDKNRLEALRYVKKLLLENKTAKKPISELDVVIGYAKKLNDSLATMPAASELATKTQAEIAVLQEYLPQPLSQEDVAERIQSILSAEPAANFGDVMKQLTPQIKGRFGGKEAADLVKSALAKA